MPGPDARRGIRAADELHPTHFHDHPRQPFADARRFKRKSTIRREKVYWRKLKRVKGIDRLGRQAGLNRHNFYDNAGRVELACDVNPINQPFESMGRG